MAVGATHGRGETIGPPPLFVNGGTDSHVSFLEGLRRGGEIYLKVLGLCGRDMSSKKGRSNVGMALLIS